MEIFLLWLAVTYLIFWHGGKESRGALHGRVKKSGQKHQKRPVKGRWNLGFFDPDFKGYLYVSADTQDKIEVEAYLIRILSLYQESLIVVRPGGTTYEFREKSEVGIEDSERWKRRIE